MRMAADTRRFALDGIDARVQASTNRREIERQDINEIHGKFHPPLARVENRDWISPWDDDPDNGDNHLRREKIREICRWRGKNTRWGV